MGSIERQFLKKKYRNSPYIPINTGCVLDIVDREGCSESYKKEYWFKSDKKVGRKGRK